MKVFVCLRRFSFSCLFLPPFFPTILLSFDGHHRLNVFFDGGSGASLQPPWWFSAALSLIRFRPNFGTSLSKSRNCPGFRAGLAFLLLRSELWGFSFLFMMTSPFLRIGSYLFATSLPPRSFFLFFDLPSGLSQISLQPSGLAGEVFLSPTLL